MTEQEAAFRRDGGRATGKARTRIDGAQWRRIVLPYMTRHHQTSIRGNSRHLHAEAVELFADDFRSKISVNDTLGPRHSKGCRSHADHPLRVEGEYIAKRTSFLRHIQSFASCQLGRIEVAPSSE